MAASPVELCNSALIKIGQERILSLDDNSKTGLLCKQRYEPIRDEMLASHPWNFALVRSDLLGELAASPEWGFSRAFQLPADCLRVLKTDLLVEDDFKVEHDAILCDAEFLKILYIRRITDTTKFRPYFDNALAWRLAGELAYSFTQSITVADNCAKQFALAISQARSFDAQEGRPDRITASSWLNSRL